MLIVRTPENPTTEKCLPSRTFSIEGIYPLSNGPGMHIIFLRVYFNNNISDVDSVHTRESNCKKVPALENIFDRGHLPSI